QVIAALRERLAVADGADRLALARLYLPLFGGYKAAVPLLNDLIKDGDQFVRREAAAALCQHGEAGKDAVPVLLEWWKASIDEARQRLSVASRRLTPRVDDRGHFSASVQRQPLGALAKLGPIAAKAADPL